MQLFCTRISVCITFRAIFVLFCVQCFACRRLEITNVAEINLRKQNDLLFRWTEHIKTTGNVQLIRTVPENVLILHILWSYSILSTAAAVVHSFFVQLIIFYLFLLFFFFFLSVSQFEINHEGILADFRLHEFVPQTPLSPKQCNPFDVRVASSWDTIIQPELRKMPRESTTERLVTVHEL